jgi:hypothetical protein
VRRLLWLTLALGGVPSACECLIDPRARCTSNADCLAVGICVSGWCVGTDGGVPDGGGPPCSATSTCKSNGAACQGGNQCFSGICEDGVCCEANCLPCQVCNLSVLGKCTTALPYSDPRGECAPYQCNGTSTQCPTSCTGGPCLPTCESGHFCNSSGSCVPKLASGASCTCCGTASCECLSGNCSANNKCQ